MTCTRVANIGKHQDEEDVSCIGGRSGHMNFTNDHSDGIDCQLCHLQLANHDIAKESQSQYLNYLN